MRVISRKKLTMFWARHDAAEGPLRAWYQTVQSADWKNPNDVKATYNTVDPVGRKLVFNIGGNKFRLVAVIDYERHKVFVRAVLDHKEYDKGEWKQDTFGDDWEKPARSASREGMKGRRNRVWRK